MTDLTQVNNELSSLMGLSEEELEKSATVIDTTVQYINSLLKDTSIENSGAIVHLCACKAYYQILLLNQSDDVTSFKAGDVSYTRASSALDNARRLYELASQQCTSLLNTPATDFVFKAV